METLFLISNMYIIPFWVMMIAAPRWQWTKRIVGSPWMAAPLALLYAVLIIPQLGSLFNDLLNPALLNIAAALSTPEGATVGWVHFLAFDLLVGRWAYLDSQEKNVSPWVMAPVLFLILMMGPLGFLAYLVIRSVGRFSAPSHAVS